MRTKTVNIFFLIYMLFSKNHDIICLKRKKYTLARVYVRRKTLIPRSFRDNRKKAPFYKFPKRKVFLFLLYNNRNPSISKKIIYKMTTSTETNGESEKRSLEAKEYHFNDISNKLNTTYWPDKKDFCPPLIQIAPMINVTNRHFRALMRMLTNRAQLWTEMIVDNTLLYNLDDLEQYLGYNKNEHPVVCQLGGSDLTSMAEAAVLVEQFGYDEININVGCPSNKVANKGAFGAHLMKEPERVRNLVYEIKKKIQIPVSVKIRTGVDNLDSFDFLQNFIKIVSSAGCTHFIVHARKAWLKGLDPKKNRKIPPLEYKKVYDLCKIFPNLKFTLNGGIKTIEESVALLNGYIPLSHAQCKYDHDSSEGNRKLHVNNIQVKGGANEISKENRKLPNEEVKQQNKCETKVLNSNKIYIKIENYEFNPLNGVMIGRASMENTVVLSQIDKLIYNEEPPATAYSRRSVLEGYIAYLEKKSSYSVVSAFELLKPILGILKGMPGHRIFRHKLDHYIRSYATTIQYSNILEKAMRDVDLAAPGVLDLPLNDRKLQNEYINNF